MNLLQTELSWAQLRSLYQLYHVNRAKATLLSNAFVSRLKTEKRLLRFKSGNLGYIEGTADYRLYFETHFLGAFERYAAFFEVSGVLSDGRRSYSLYDLETLIYIWKNKAVLAGNLTTLRTFSAELFKGKGSKYLENNHSVLAAVLHILEIDKFPKSDPKERQWRLVVDCADALNIMLCENLDALKLPDEAIALKVELWYVGGNNTKILENLSTDKLRLPVCYRCDWDYNGLLIYESVQRIMADKGAGLRLLMPYDTDKKLPVNSPYHYSEWKRHRTFSGLAPEKYSDEARDLIVRLIAGNEWIEEESQEIEQQLRFNGVI